MEEEGREGDIATIAWVELIGVSRDRREEDWHLETSEPRLRLFRLVSAVEVSFLCALLLGLFPSLRAVEAIPRSF